MCSKILMTANIVIVILLMAALSSAQPPTYDMQKHNSIKFSYLRESDDSRTSFWAGYLNWGFASSKNIKYNVEIPYAHHGHGGYYDYPGMGGYSDDAFGNIFIGFEGGKPRSGVYYEAGLRIPTASDKDWALPYNLITDIARSDAFAHDVTVAKGALGYRSENESGLVTLLKLGPAFWFNGSEDESEDESEFFVNYSAHLWYYGEISNFGFGITGTGILTEDYYFISNQFVNRFEFGMGFKTGKFSPGFEIFLPMSNDLELIKYTMGLNVTLNY